MAIKQHIHWLRNASKGIRLRIAISCVVGIVRVCASLLFIWVCKQLIDIASHTTEGDMRLYTVLLIIIVAIELLLSAWSNRLENRNDIRLKNKLRL